jgi:hypothetical protein
MSNETIDGLLFKLGTVAAAKLSPSVLECVDSNDMALTTAQRLGKQRTENLNRRHFLDAEKASKSRKRAINEAYEAVAKERSSFMNTLPNDINFLKIMLHTNHLAKIVEGRSSLDLLESLRKKHKEDIYILENQLVNSHAGIGRRNITSLKWH